MNPQDIATLRLHAHNADKAGLLQPEQLKLINDNGWFRLLAPAAVGGLEMPLPDVVRLEEQIAQADGSCGWVVTLCAGAGWFGGFLPLATAREVLGHANACIAGSGAATGYADIVEGGYILTGEWAHASGAPLATHFTANAVVRKDGEALKDSEGTAFVRAFIFPAKDVVLKPSWNTIGMRATASQVYGVNQCFVSEACCFDISPDAATSDSPLYRYPFLQLAEVTLAANISGMALHFLDACLPILQRRRSLITKSILADVPAVSAAVKEAAASIAGSRLSFYESLDASWTGISSDSTIPSNLLNRVSSRSQALVATARQVVDMLYPYCGLTAADPDCQINLVWRDLHTATQHGLLCGIY